MKIQLEDMSEEELQDYMSKLEAPLNIPEGASREDVVELIKLAEADTSAEKVITNPDEGEVGKADEDLDGSTSNDEGDLTLKNVESSGETDSGSLVAVCFPKFAGSFRVVEKVGIHFDMQGQAMVLPKLVPLLQQIS